MFNLVALLCMLIVPVSILDVERVAFPKTYTIHVRELTKPECVTRKSVADADTVLDAVASLNLKQGKVLQMDLWLSRIGRDGEAQMFIIDWAGITQRGQTATNFLLRAGDQLFLQERLRK